MQNPPSTNHHLQNTARCRVLSHGTNCTLQGSIDGALAKLARLYDMRVQCRPLLLNLPRETWSQIACVITFSTVATGDEVGPSQAKLKGANVSMSVLLRVPRSVRGCVCSGPAAKSYMVSYTVHIYIYIYIYIYIHASHRNMTLSKLPHPLDQLVRETEHIGPWALDWNAVKRIRRRSRASLQRNNGKVRCQLNNFERLLVVGCLSIQPFTSFDNHGCFYMGGEVLCVGKCWGWKVACKRAAQRMYRTHLLRFLRDLTEAQQTCEPSILAKIKELNMYIYIYRVKKQKDGNALLKEGLTFPCLALLSLFSAIQSV